jgi:spermidine dehydrogenase
VAAEGKPDWAAYLAKTPLSACARKDFLRIQVERIDYLPHLTTADKKRALDLMSFKDFLVKHAEVDPQVVTYFQRITHGGFGAGIDAISAHQVLAMGLRGEDMLFSVARPPPSSPEWG